MIDKMKENAEGTTAYYAGRTLMWPFRKTLAFIVWFAMGILSKLPKRTAVYQKLITKGYECLYRNTDAHVVVNTIYGDDAVVPRPAQIDTDEQTVETNNGEEWTATSGVETVRIGDAPVATGVADQHEMVDHVAARIAEAVDYSPLRQQPVDRTDAGYVPIRYQGPLQQAADGSQQGQMRADGAGDAAAVQREATRILDELLPRQCTFADVWIDASNPIESNDGWIISMEKAYELHWDQAASEEMQKQEDRGRLAEMDPDKHKREQLIMVAIAIGCTALGMFGPSLAAQIAGSAGGALDGTSVGLNVGHLLGVI